MKYTLLFLMCLGLTACVSAPKVRPFHLPDYTLSKPLIYQIQSKEIISQVHNSHRLPHIGHKMPVSPEDAIKDFVRQRFPEKQSALYTLKVVIENADMRQEHDIKDHWYQQNNLKYTLTYSVRFQFYQGGVFMFEKALNGYEMQSVPKRTKLAEKEQIWQEMMTDMLKKINQKLEEDNQTKAPILSPL